MFLNIFKKNKKKARVPPFHGYKERPRLEYEMPWKFLHEETGFVFCKDNSLLSLYRFNGPKAQLERQKQQLLNCLKVSNAFMKLGTGFAVYIETQRFTAPPVSTPYLQALEEEKQETGEVSLRYNSEYYLIFSWVPQEAYRKAIQRFFIYSSPINQAKTKRSRKKGPTPEEIEKTRKTFENICSYMKNTSAFLVTLLSPFFEDLVPLSLDETLNYLYSTILGADQTLSFTEYKESEKYLCDYLAYSSMTYGQTPRIGEKWLKIVRLKALTPAMDEEVLEALNNLNIPYRWSCRFQCLSNKDAKKMKANYQRFWNSANTELTPMDFINLDKYKVVEGDEEDKDPGPKIVMIDGKQDEPDVLGVPAEGFYTSIILVEDTDKKACQQKAQSVLTALHRLGLTAYIELDGSVESWRGSQPGNYRCGLKYPAVNVLNFVSYDYDGPEGGGLRVEDQEAETEEGS